MGLSADDRKETLELMSDAFALGMAKFRSAAEEEAAKGKAAEPPAKTGEENNGGDFSLADYILGR